MPGEGVTIQLEGVKGVVHLFDVLPEHLHKTVMRQSLQKTGRIIANAIKANARFKNATGAYKRSVGVRVRYYRDSDATIAFVGPRRGSQFEGRSRIAHLLEYGWRTARGGTLKRTNRQTDPVSKRTGARGEGVSTGFVAGKHIVERAYASTKGQVESILLAELRTGVEREVELLNSHA